MPSSLEIRSSRARSMSIRSTMKFRTVSPGTILASSVTPVLPERQAATERAWFRKRPRPCQEGRRRYDEPVALRYQEACRRHLAEVRHDREWLRELLLPLWEVLPSGLLPRPTAGCECEVDPAAS